MRRIPLVDLRAQYLAHKDEFDAALGDCLARASFIGGPDHAAFGREFAAWSGGGHAALVGNGTDALSLALTARLGPGDGTGEVITASHTFIASAEAISAAGYRPTFTDIDPATHVLDPARIEAAITPRTRAVMPVHLYGQMVPMDRVAALARAHRLAVIEDAAQSHGATWQGRPAGALSDAACYSFYPGKNLGAWGDGGAVVSRDQDLAARITMRANHGRSDKYSHEFIGLNSRLDGLQAAILRVKLRHLDDWTAARRRVAGWYRAALTSVNGITLPHEAPGAHHVYHLFVVEVDDREAVRATLTEAGVGTGVHYPIPVHEQPAYADLGYRPQDLPVTAAAARRVLSLPIYPELGRAAVERVAETLIAAVGGRAAAKRRRA